MPNERDAVADSTISTTWATGNGARRCAIWLASIIGVTQAVGLFLPALLRADLFAGDARQHIWWLYRFADPELFPNNFIAEFFSRPLFAPYGFQALYGLLIRWFDAQTVSETIPFVLTIPVLVLAWLIGRRTAGGHFLGGFVAVIVAVFALLIPLLGGFPRCFAPPILMLGVWALMARRLGWLGLAFLLAAFFYPQAGINLGLLASVVLGVRIFRERRLPRGWGWLVIPGLAALVIVGSVYGRPAPPGIGPKITLQKAKTMPEFGTNGRSRFFEKDWVTFYLESRRSGLGIRGGKYIALVVVLIVAASRFRSAVPLEAWALLATSLAAFVLAHATLFTLHLPNRFVFSSIYIFFMMCLAGVAARVWMSLRQKPLLKGFTNWVGQPRVLAGIIVLVAVGFVTNSIVRCRAELSEPPAPDREALYAFLNALPKSVLIGAHPADANSIPLRSRRSVVASEEVALPYYLGYYRKISERITAELAACFASDWVDVQALNTRFGADVFVVNLARYRDPENNSFFMPYREGALVAIARGREKGFVLEHPPADRILFAQGDYLVVSLKLFTDHARNLYRQPAAGPDGGPALLQ